MADREQFNHPIYRAWAGMKARCKRPFGNNRFYKGVTYDPAWESFAQFETDMPGWKPGLTLDRIDNTKGYSKENCRWATVKQQANNRKSNRFFTIDGITKTLAEWCETAAVPPSHVRTRFYVYGWEIKEALTKPSRSVASG